MVSHRAETEPSWRQPWTTPLATMATTATNATDENRPTTLSMAAMLWGPSSVTRRGRSTQKHSIASPPSQALTPARWTTSATIATGTHRPELAWPA